MKWLIPVLVVLLLSLQYRLWLGEGSVANIVQLTKEIDQQRAENERLQERNRILAAEVEALRKDMDAIEEKARSDLGMVKEGETFFLFIDKERD